MNKQLTRSFKVEPDSWGKFLKAAETYGASPSELLRELVENVDAAMKGIEDNRFEIFKGDIPRLIRAEFSQFSAYQLQRMANVLLKAAGLSSGHSEKEKSFLE